MADSLLGARLDVLLARTEQANEIVRREPREIPRRLRGLVLAIDGNQTARTYIERLDGFGDVESLLVELISLGLVRFQYRHRAPNPSEEDLLMQDMGRSGAFAASDLNPLNNLLGDPARMKRALAESTVRGPFDDLVRVMRADQQFGAAPPDSDAAPAPDAALRQMESLFTLLEAVRADRKNLRERVVAMRKYRERAHAMQKQNKRLRRCIGLLGAGCAALLLLLVLQLN